MTLLKGIEKIITGKNPPIDIWHYFVGNFRYKLFYHSDIVYRGDASKVFNGVVNPKHPLMRQHIWEQINYRIIEMDRQCYMNGQCKICQCSTTNLQMANKRCGGICYPTMMGKEDWERFKKGGSFVDIDGVWIKRKELSKENPSGLDTDKHIFYKETSNSYVPYNKD